MCSSSDGERKREQEKNMVWIRWFAILNELIAKDSLILGHLSQDRKKGWEGRRLNI